VILSDYYDLPFNDILDWHKFAVILRERDVYQLKQILKNISDAEFAQLHMNMVKVKVLSWHLHVCIEKFTPRPATSASFLL